MSTFIKIRHQQAADLFQVQASHQVGACHSTFTISLTRAAAIRLCAAYRAHKPDNVGTAEGLITLDGSVLDVSLRRGVEHVTATIPSHDIITSLERNLERRQP